MATASAFGFSGWDPIGSFGEGSLANYFHGKSQKNSLKNQYKYYKQSLLESPGLQRKGLQDAGYNPMLAISSGLPSPFTGSGSAMSMPAGSAGGFDATAFAGSVSAMRNLRKKDAAATKTAELAPVKAQAEIDRINAETRNLNVGTGKTVADAITTNPVVAPAAAYGGYKLVQAIKSFLGRSSLGSLASAAGHSARSVPAIVAGSSMLAPLLLGSAVSFGYGFGKKHLPKYGEKVDKNMRKQISVLGLPVVY